MPYPITPEQAQDWLTHPWMAAHDDVEKLASAFLLADKARQDERRLHETATKETQRQRDTYADDAATWQKRAEEAEAKVAAVKVTLSTLLADLNVMDRAALGGDHKQPPVSMLEVRSGADSWGNERGDHEQPVPESLREEYAKREYDNDPRTMS